MHIKMSMLEEWRQTKVSTITLTTSTIHILKTLNSYQVIGLLRHHHALPNSWPHGGVGGAHVPSVNFEYIGIIFEYMGAI